MAGAADERREAAQNIINFEYEANNLPMYLTFRYPPQDADAHVWLEMHRLL